MAAEASGPAFVTKPLSPPAQAQARQGPGGTSCAAWRPEAELMCMGVSWLERVTGRQKKSDNQEFAAFQGKFFISQN